VVLPDGHTGSSLLHALLHGAAAKSPDAFRAVSLPPSVSAFKRGYGESLARFEAARVVSDARVDIARDLVRSSHEVFEYAEGDHRVPLVEYLAKSAGTPKLASLELRSGRGLRPELPWEGRMLRGREIAVLAERLAEANHMTQHAARALGWIVEHIEACGGALDLRGHRFAVLGAGAELSATRLLLQAGARVLWIDRSDPASLLAEREELCGTLVCPSAGRNLLEEPREVVAAARAFAEQHGPVHLCMFAYAAGASQDWRLGTVMNAIAAQLSPKLLRSVALLVSPTTVGTLQPECVAAAQEALSRAPLWKAALQRAKLLRAPGHHAERGVAIARATVSIQGASYQAAQYVSKLLAAEAYAVYGSRLDASARTPLTVSANVAGITRTRSLGHPLFQAAFIGAPYFGVRVFEPATTRVLSGLLMLHDLLNASAPGSASVQPRDVRQKAADLHAQQVHGGIYGLPYVLEQAIRIAALIGMGRSPGVLVRGRERASARATAKPPAAS
jgi:hypothetical protein